MGKVVVQVGKYIMVRFEPDATKEEKDLIERCLRHLKYWSGPNPLLQWAGNHFLQINLHEDDRESRVAESSDSIFEYLQLLLREREVVIVD